MKRSDFILSGKKGILVNIAILSDIHGNYTALETCLDYLKDKNIDAFCFLGDYVGEFPGVEQTIKTLYALQEKYPCYILRGNKENYLIDGLGTDTPEWDAYPSTVGMLRYAYNHISKDDIRFFKNLPIAMRIINAGFPDIMICHGSPRKVNEKFAEEEQILKEVVKEANAEYIICGHTHQIINRKYGKTHIWNAGSVGASFDMPYSYRFLILHGESGEWKPEYVSLEADVERLLCEMREAGLYETAPFWTRFTELQVKSACGGYTHGDLLNKAMKICRDRYGECEWPKVSEECFSEAFEILFPNVYSGHGQ